MQDRLVSVVIPNHNYGRYLREAIESVLSQSYANVEVVVIDDGSTDDSIAVLRSYRDRVRWFQQPREGVSAARNRGILESRGGWVAFLDADDFWHPEKLARQMALTGRAGVGLVHCGVRYVSAAGAPAGAGVSLRRGRVLRELALLEGPTVLGAGSTCLVRRECFDRVGLFDTALSTAADWDMCRRLACHYDIEAVAEALVFYRLHSSAMHCNVEVMERDMLRAFEKMFSDPAAAEVRRLRRAAYGRLFMILSGSYLHAGRWRRCLAYGLRAAITWPPSLLYVTGLPARWVLRRASRGQGIR